MSELDLARDMRAELQRVGASLDDAARITHTTLLRRRARNLFRQSVDKEPIESETAVRAAVVVYERERAAADTSRRRVVKIGRIGCQP